MWAVTEDDGEIDTEGFNQTETLLFLADYLREHKEFEYHTSGESLPSTSAAAQVGKIMQGERSELESGIQIPYLGLDEEQEGKGPDELEAVGFLSYNPQTGRNSIQRITGEIITVDTYFAMTQVLLYRDERAIVESYEAQGNLEAIKRRPKGYREPARYIKREVRVKNEENLR